MATLRTRKGSREVNVPVSNLPVTESEEDNQLATNEREDALHLYGGRGEERRSDVSSDNMAGGE